MSNEGEDGQLNKPTNLVRAHKNIALPQVSIKMWFSDICFHIYAIIHNNICTKYKHLIIYLVGS